MLLSSHPPLFSHIRLCRTALLGLNTHAAPVLSLCFFNACGLFEMNLGHADAAWVVQCLLYLYYNLKAVCFFPNKVNLVLAIQRQRTQCDPTEQFTAAFI